MDTRQATEPPLWLTTLTPSCSVEHHPPRPAVVALVHCAGIGELELSPTTRLCRDCARCARPGCSQPGYILTEQDRPACWSHRPACWSHRDDHVQVDDDGPPSAYRTVLVRLDSVIYRDLSRGDAR